eukprot:TRINITY_DN1660_c0_g1_i1.p1 TRINITY_DN1660_c0_g1~~TRINITY_DN1660_c0_g1_i1.p1  ORF type:complete len:441 (+),score=104.52 TRINITY_DN1660_c0_g1_i1:33-1325(+)
MTSNVSNDMQWIILAGGKGRRLNPLTKEIPKSLLPVANRPILSYLLEMLDHLLIDDVILITNESNQESIQEFLQSEKSKVRVDTVVVSDYMGTAGSLLHIKDRIHKDFVVVSGDIIVSPDQIYPFLDLHRLEDAAVTVHLFPNTGLNVQKKGKSNVPKVIDYIGLDNNNRVITFQSNTDPNSPECITVKKSVLRKFPNVKIYSKLRDAHLYAFSNWTLDFLEKHQSLIQSIKSDFIPLLVRAQYRSKLTKDLDLPENNYSNRNSDLESDKDRIKCFAFLNYRGYCTRSNNLEHYVAANRDLASGNNFYRPREPEGARKKNLCNYISQTAQIDEKIQIPMGCVVGDDSVLQERVGLKGSIIGKNCNIESGARIINSIVMDGVTIRSGARIQNCIICSDVVVGENGSLDNCQIISGIVLPANVDLKDEVIQH